MLRQIFGHADQANGPQPIMVITGLWDVHDRTPSGHRVSPPDPRLARGAYVAAPAVQPARPGRPGTAGGMGPRPRSPPLSPRRLTRPPPGRLPRSGWPARSRGPGLALLARLRRRPGRMLACKA